MLLVPAAFLCLCLVMWLYCLTLRALGRTGFEMETIAFFLSTLSLAVTASSAPASVPKQLLAVFLGIVLFLVVGIFLRDLDRVRKIRWLMAGRGRGPAEPVPGGGPRAVRGGQLDQPVRLLLPALGAGQDLLYLRRGGHPGAACSASGNLGLFILLTGAVHGLSWP